MALRSDLFRGDARLEAAAAVDGGHIVPGSSGTHVGKIQYALALLDNARIAQQEVLFGLYGASTARCVLSYKQKRSIINRSYQTTADNIVGKMTMASLEREMASWRSTHLRCGCNYAPVGSVARHRSFVGHSLVALRASAPAGAAQTPLQMALAAAPAALAMRNKALQAVNAVIDGAPTPEAALGAEALARHYKAAAGPDMAATARSVRESLAGVASRLLSARAWLREGSSPQGFAETPQPRDGHTYILPNYAVAGPLMRPTILIREAFHDLDMFNEDSGRNPANDQGAAYHKNDTRTQLKNAYAMSQFCVHIHAGKERFLADGE